MTYERYSRNRYNQCNRDNDCKNTCHLRLLCAVNVGLIKQLKYLTFAKKVSPFRFLVWPLPCSIFANYFHLQGQGDFI